MKVNKLIKLESLAFILEYKGSVLWMVGTQLLSHFLIDMLARESILFNKTLSLAWITPKKQPFPHIIPTTIIMTAISQKRMAMFGVYLNLYRKKSFFLIIDVGGLDIWREICVYICVTTVNIDIKMYTAHIYMVEKRCIYLCSMTQQHW